MSTSQAAAVPLDQPLYGASFGQAIRRFFVKYATFSGRASRSEFWFAVLFVFLILILIWIPGLALGFATGTREISQTTGRPTTVPGPIIIPFIIIGVLFYVGTLVPHIAVTVRRLHDANFSGLLALLALVPQVGGLIVTIFMFIPSNPLGARFDAGAQAQFAAGYQPYPGQVFAPGQEYPAAQPAPGAQPAVPPVPPPPPPPAS